MTVLVVYSEDRKTWFLQLFFFSPQKGFGYSWSFFVSIQILRIFCSNSVKNAISNLQGLHWICRLLWIVHFGNINSSNLRTQFVFPLCHLYFISILHFLEYWPLCCFSSIAQLCLTLWSPMDCSTSGFPVPHYLPKFTQVHVHCISDAIQPCHPLIFFCPQISQYQGFYPMSQLFASGDQYAGA